LQATSGDKIKFLNLERQGTKEGKNLNSNMTPALLNILLQDITESIEKANKRAKKTIELLGMDKLLKANSVWDKEFILPEANDADDGATENNEDNDDNEDNEDDDDDKVHEKDDSRYAADDSLKLSIIGEVCTESQNEVENNLDLACSEGLVSKEVKEQLIKLKEALPVEKIPSDTIPMYAQKTLQNLIFRMMIIRIHLLHLCK